MPARTATLVPALLLAMTLPALPARAQKPRTDLCDLVPGGGAGDRPNAQGGYLKDAVTDQVKNIVWEVIKSRGGSWEGIGEGLNAVDNMAISPVVAAATSPEDKIDGYLRSFLEGSAKVVFPALDVTITGGRVLVAGVSYGVEELYTMTNPGYDLRLAAQLDFFKVEPQFSRGITEESLGEKVKSEAELRKLWFTTYRWKLRDFMKPQEIETLLNDRWPSLLRGWQMTHGRYVMRLFHDDLLTRIRALNRKLGEKRTEAAPAQEVFGLWRTKGGSVVAVTGSGTSIETVFCVPGETARKLGFKRGDKQYWGGRTNALSAAEGRTIVYLHAFARAQPGDCPRLAPYDLGTQGAKLSYDPESDTLTVTEKTRLYSDKTCRWVKEGEPEVVTWARVR